MNKKEIKELFGKDLEFLKSNNKDYINNNLFTHFYHSMRVL